MSMPIEELEALCRRIVHENPRQADAYRQGKSMLGFFVGRVMTETKGTVNPTQTSGIFRHIMDAQ